MLCNPIECFSISRPKKPHRVKIKSSLGIPLFFMAENSFTVNRQQHITDQIHYCHGNIGPTSWLGFFSSTSHESEPTFRKFYTLHTVQRTEYIQHTLLRAYHTINDAHPQSHRIIVPVPPCGELHLLHHSRSTGILLRRHFLG